MNSIKSRITTFIILLFICRPYYGQIQNNNLNLPDIVIPSQETFAISRINYEPNSSGQFSYQYPIDNSMRTPISLNYTSGVRVDDMGTSTGMSWQLNAGGVISRIVKDRADEKNTNWKPLIVDETADLQQIRSAAQQGNNIDTEYDWFNYSISNGLSGSFYIDYNLNTYIESGDKIKIQILDVTPQGSPNRSQLEFKITDNSGTVYYFGGSTTNIETTTYTDRGIDRIAVTGWYIYKIETTSNKLTDFIYTSEDISYYTDLSAGFSVQPNCPAPYGEGGYRYTGINISESQTRSVKPKLSGIVEDNKEVKFFYDKERKDLLTNNNGTNLLTSIEVRTNGRVITNYIFDYFDIKTISAETYYQLPYTEGSTTNRHFLKSIAQLNKGSKTEFEYYNLELLPARFSLKTDYYGYANGTQNISPFPKIAYDNNFGIFKSLNMVPQSIMSADKSVNPLLASVGNLKKIIHPTKGTSEIFYEPNSSMETVNEPVVTKNSLVVAYNRCNSNNSNKSKSFEFDSNGSFIEFSNQASFDYYQGCGEPDNTHDIHQLEITDVTTNDGVNLVNPGSRKISWPFTAEEGTNHYPINTNNGHRYKVEYSVSSRFGAVTGNIHFQFNKRFEPKEKLVYFGGSRVSSINESDLEGNSYSKKIYYNKLANIASQTTSIADYNPLHISATIEETGILCNPSSGFPAIIILPSYTASQSSILPLFNHRRNNPFYTFVTEIIENKSAVERRFSYQDNIDPYIGHLPEIYYLPKSNYGEIRSNLLKEENFYKFDNGFKILTSKLIDYDYSQIKSKKSYAFRQNFAYYSQPGEDPLINISYGFYENYYGFFKPTKTTTTEYVNGTPIVTTVDYYYNNASHNQLTRQKTTYPDLSYQTTEYSYASEKGNTYLEGKNMIGIPLLTQTSKTINGATKTISKTETVYPNSEQQAKERILNNAEDKDLALPRSVLSYNLDNLGSSDLEASYDYYDNKGNLLQYTTKSGIPSAIVWGYNNTQPIAKIEGARYSDVSAYISTIVSKSDTDNSNGSAASEQDLLDALDQFRKTSQLSGFQITTYSYDPLVGVRSITPPNGVRENYIYDTANRLEQVVDINGRILKEYKYNYKQ